MSDNSGDGLAIFILCIIAFVCIIIALPFFITGCLVLFALTPFFPLFRAIFGKSKSTIKNEFSYLFEFIFINWKGVAVFAVFCGFCTSPLVFGSIMGKIRETSTYEPVGYIAQKFTSWQSTLPDGLTLKKRFSWWWSYYSEETFIDGHYFNIKQTCPDLWTVHNAKATSGNIMYAETKTTVWDTFSGSFMIYDYLGKQEFEIKMTFKENIKNALKFLSYTMDIYQDNNKIASANNGKPWLINDDITITSVNGQELMRFSRVKTITSMWKWKATPIIKDESNPFAPHIIATIAGKISFTDANPNRIGGQTDSCNDVYQWMVICLIITCFFILCVLVFSTYFMYKHGIIKYIKTDILDVQNPQENEKKKPFNVTEYPSPIYKNGDLEIKFPPRIYAVNAPNNVEKV